MDERIELMDMKSRSALLLEDLRTVVDKNELFLLYQPIVDIVRGEIVSLEALVRWNHPELGIVEPGEFISLAEDHDLITLIDEWVVDEVLSQNRDYPIHVNLSTQDLMDIRFRNRIITIIKDNPEKIILELTETTKFELSQEIKDALHDVNAKLSIDDFGTGYSSMARLTSLEVASLKIDQSFVRNSGTDVQSASICIAIIKLGKALNIEVIAEGAETPEQIRFLYRYGCRFIQGYGISKPIPYEAIKGLDIKRFMMGPQDKYSPESASGQPRVDFSTAMVLELNEQNNFIRIPMSFCQFVGYSHSELKKMTMFDLMPDEEFGLCKVNCRILKETGYIENAVMYLLCSDGVRKCVSITGKKGTGGDKSTYMYIEQNEADEQLVLDIQMAQGAYSTMFHEGPLATVVWRHDYEIIDWNKEAEATFGWKRDEAIGTNLIRLLVGRDSVPEYLNMVGSILSETSNDSINYNIKKSGEQIICRWVNRVVRDSQGEVRFFISIIKDITEDLRKNDQIKQLSSAVEKSGFGTVLTDSTGAILSVNSRISELTGYSESELVGSDMNILITRAAQPEIYKDIGATIRSGRVWEGEIFNKKKDGSQFLCKTTIVPVVSEWSKTVNYFGIHKDLTKEKDLEEKADTMRTMVIEQEKLATLGLMMAGITHEAFNYMAYAESNLEYARDLAEKASKGKTVNLDELLSATEDAQEGVARLKDILLSLKKASRKDDVPLMESCEINHEIQMVLALVKNEYKYDAVIEFPIGKNIPHTGYPGLLRQVLMNILINAAHAIKARNIKSLGKITIHAVKGIDSFRIVIKDNGVGMSEKTRSRVFEPFFTTKESGKGTGLGLSISKDIIEKQYDGRLMCTSLPGTGTIFVIEVPNIARIRSA